MLTKYKNIVYNIIIMSIKRTKMFNKKQMISKEIQKVITEDLYANDTFDYDSLKNKKYSQVGFDYWQWMDLLANLEAKFSKDLTATTEKFKIETIDELINALYNAPEMKSLYKNN